MSVDDPKKPEFDSWDSYRKFQQRVRKGRRYVWDDEIQAFLDTVRRTRNNRDVEIPEGSTLWRAQVGIDYMPTLDPNGNPEVEVPTGFPAERMKPLANSAREGRANSVGIPVLYLASSELTAISEVRPWIGSEVSLAQFKILRNLRSIDLSHRYGRSSFEGLTIGQIIGQSKSDTETKERSVWTDIDNAFSEPVTLSEDIASYIPTQILAELFLDAGYDAILYRSRFGEIGYNIAVFNIENAEVLNCAPYEITDVKVDYKETGNRWFSRSQSK